MTTSKLGTLVLLDMENLKTPTELSGNKYILPKIDIIAIREALQKTLFDTHYNFIAFNKRYWKTDKKFEKNINFLGFLKHQGFEVVTKLTKKVNSSMRIKGKDLVYTYEECDMDAEIVHTIHSIGKNYSRIILLSGDSDMKSALDYVSEEYGVNIVIVSHKEHLSNAYKNYRCIYLHELMDQRYVQKQKD